MSIIPFLIDELQAPQRRHYPYDLEDFLTPRELMFLRQPPSRFQRPTGSSLKNDPNEFRVNLDVQQFKPEEVSVKIVGDFIVVEGKHEERQDEHGFVQRQFQRRYLIPKEVDPTAIQSSLSSDGVLSVSAPKKHAVKQGERQIPIIATNQPAMPTATTPAKPAEAGDGDGK